MQALAVLESKMSDQGCGLAVDAAIYYLTSHSIMITQASILT